MSRNTPNMILTAGCTIVIICVLTALIAAATNPAISGETQGDIGRSLPSFHCKDNPQIEDCRPDQPAMSVPVEWPVIRPVLTWTAVGVAMLVAALFVSAVQQIRFEPDPAERRKRWFDLTLRTLAIIAGTFVAVCAVFFRLFGG